MRLVSEEVKNVLPKEFQRDNLSQEEIIDFLFDTLLIEIRPRPYKGDFGQFLWCCEVHNWNVLGHYPKMLANCETKEEVINNAILYVFTELC